MLERLIKGFLIGLIACAGAFSLGADLRILAAIFAVPLVFAFFDLMISEVFSLFLLFGIGALLWSYTALGDVAMDGLNKVAPQSFARPSPNETPPK